MRTITLALLTLSLLPASALAAEVPPLTLSKMEVGCAAPTGLPGEIVTSGRNAVQLVTATQTGLQKGRAFALEYSAGCAVAASQPNRAGVLAIPDDSGVLVALREPGGDWSEPTGFPGDEGLSTGKVAVAVSEAGDALVVWQNVGPKRRIRTYAARRLAGGGFSAPVKLADRRQVQESWGVHEDWFAAGIADGGEAIVAWTGLPAERPPHRATVRVAIAPAGGGFGAPTAVGEQTGYSSPSLAMAPDGRALLTIATPERVQVRERTTGTPFGAPVTVADVNDPLGTRTAAALGAPGEAVVTWSGAGLGGVHTAIRGAGGPFSAALPTAAADTRIRYDVWTAVNGFTQDLPSGSWSFGGTKVTARIANGIALLGWTGPRGRTTAANLATYPLLTGAGVRQTLGGELVDTWNAFPLLLADGTVALAWADGAARLHAATGAPADTSPLPEVRVSPPKSRTVSGSLVLPFRCSAACQVRAELVDRHGEGSFKRLRAAGSGRLRLTDVDAPTRLCPVRVRFTIGGADGRRTRSWTTTYRLVRTRAHRLVELAPVRAERRGDKVHVTVRVERRLPSELFTVVGGFARRGNVEPLATRVVFFETSQREATATLPAAGVRWVAVLWGDKRTFVRVR